MGPQPTDHTPTQTATLGVGRTAVAVSAGVAHTCAILDDGNVSCWGYNGNGQLGDGTYTKDAPTQTTSLGIGRSAIALEVGYQHTCCST